MKKVAPIFVALFLTASIFCQTKLPFSKGIDMLTFFESWTGELPDLNKYDETDFAMLKSMGVEIIRLPIHFENFMEPAYTGKVYDIVFVSVNLLPD